MQAIRSRIEKSPNQYAVSPSSSLMLKGLAQARRTLAQVSSYRLGESSTYKIVTLCAFSLRRDSPRLSETLARSKLSRSPERPIVEKGLSAPLLISPRRDRLAWARLSNLAAVSLRQPLIPNQSHTVKHPKHSEHRIIQRLSAEEQKQQ